MEKLLKMETLLNMEKFLSSGSRIRTLISTRTGSRSRSGRPGHGPAPSGSNDNGSVGESGRESGPLVKLLQMMQKLLKMEKLLEKKLLKMETCLAVATELSVPRTRMSVRVPPNAAPCQSRPAVAQRGAVSFAGKPVETLPWSKLEKLLNMEKSLSSSWTR